MAIPHGATDCLPTDAFPENFSIQTARQASSHTASYLVTNRSGCPQIGMEFPGFAETVRLRGDEMRKFYGSSR
jgi:hypothetical protein